MKLDLIIIAISLILLTIVPPTTNILQSLEFIVLVLELIKTIQELQDKNNR